jgi:hypothetical protein
VRPSVPGGQAVAAVETRPSWSNFRQARAVVAYRPHLRKTIRVALVVGTILFSINQLDVVLRHQATDATWLKVALTYLVPFCVANYGILVAMKAIPRKGGND